MYIKALVGILMIWGALTSIGLSLPKTIDKMSAQNKSDQVAVDEQLSKYPGLDLEDVCKGAKNPKCEAIIDNFCLKSCRADLCAKLGSIRAMCRLMCEAEDLPPSCMKLRPPTGMINQQGQWMTPPFMNPQQMNPQWVNPQWGRFPR